MDFELLLVRHGEAERYVPEGDSARPLTPDGIRDVTRASAILSTIVDGFDAVITSPFLRAVQTGAIYCSAFGYTDEPVEWAGLTPSSPADATADELLTRGRNLHNGARLAVFGHNPNITTVSALLVAGRSDAYFNFRPGDALHLLVPERMPYTRPGEGPAAVVLGFYPCHQLANLG